MNCPSTKTGQQRSRSAPEVWRVTRFRHEDWSGVTWTSVQGEAHWAYPDRVKTPLGGFPTDPTLYSPMGSCDIWLLGTSLLQSAETTPNTMDYECLARYRGPENTRTSYKLACSLGMDRILRIFFSYCSLGALELNQGVPLWSKRLFPLVGTRYDHRGGRKVHRSGVGFSDFGVPEGPDHCGLQVLGSDHHR